MAESLTKIINASGFVFQLAVEEAIRATSDQHGWTIISAEHGWQASDTPRFADLVLARHSVWLVIECKRTREADWVFLIPETQATAAIPSKRCRAIRLDLLDPKLRSLVRPFIWEFLLEPDSWESSFCAVRGTGDDQRPMLDRLCAELTSSVDQIASQELMVREEREFQAESKSIAPTIIPVIVTNARLHVCVFNSAAVSLEKGELPDSLVRFETANAVRYTKAFDAPSGDRTVCLSISELALERHRTVSIVNATHLTTWLVGVTVQKMKGEMA
jgi:hypothetical protein